MEIKDSISNTFLALNYISLSQNYSSSVTQAKLNFKRVWEVFLNPIKYQDKINEMLKDKVFAKAYFMILQNEGCIYQPKLRAASNDKVFFRSSSEFKIEIVKSNKNQNVYYIIINLINDTKLPLLNLYVICENISESKKLPKFNNKQAQMIIKDNDNFFDLITNPNTEIFIR